MTAPLTDRERQVLEAVIETYVQTAEPAGSRTIAQRHQLGHLALERCTRGLRQERKHTLRELVATFSTADDDPGR